MEPTSLADKCKLTVQTLAVELGLKKMVNPDGTAVKVTNQMVIDKVLALQAELAAANAAIETSRALCTAAQGGGRAFEHLLDDLAPVLGLDAVEIDDSSDSDCSGDTKRAREPPEDDDDDTQEKRQKLSMHLFDPAVACESKTRVVAGLANIPAEYGGLCKYTRFVGAHGARVVAVGWNSTKKSYPVVAVLESDLCQPFPLWSQMVIHHYAPEYVCKQLGIDIASSVEDVRLRVKFWRNMGGQPRRIQAMIGGQWRTVEVTKWNHRRKKLPIVVNCLEPVNGSTVWNLPMNMQNFREVQ